LELVSVTEGSIPETENPPNIRGFRGNLFRECYNSQRSATSGTWNQRQRQSAVLTFHVLGEDGATSQINLNDGFCPMMDHSACEALEIPASWVNDSVAVAQASSR
jgi:hypothetical protein